MAFDESATIPDNIARGSRSGLSMKADVIELDGGVDEVVARWPDARRTLDLSYGVRKFDDIQTLREFYLCRDGIARGFRARNPLDYTTKPTGVDRHRGTPTDEDYNIGTGDGSNKTFQLKKTYTNGGRTITWNIRKPRTGTVIVALDGVSKTEGVHYTVDHSTGEVLFNSAPGVGQPVTAGCTFDTPVRFARPLDDLFEVTVSAFEGGDIPSVPCIEMLGDVVTPELPAMGGSSRQAFSVALIYDWAMGQTVEFDPSASGLVVVLPDLTNLPDGGPLLHFINIDPTHSISFLNRATGGVEFTLAADTGALVFVTLAAGVKDWRALKGV